MARTPTHIATSASAAPKILRCAVYTRKSTEEGLDQEFNSLDAQREASVAFISSQKGLGWTYVEEQYDDGGYSGGTIERPALQRLIADIKAGKIDVVVVYKLDRFSRSMADFHKLMEVFTAHDVAFVSITQQFNTTTSMGRMVLNMLLTFAQFERELIGERTRDKIAAARRKGKWAGGAPVLGYDVDANGKLAVNEAAEVSAREDEGVGLSEGFFAGEVGLNFFAQVACKFGADGGIVRSHHRDATDKLSDCSLGFR